MEPVATKVKHVQAEYVARVEGKLPELLKMVNPLEQHVPLVQEQLMELEELIIIQDSLVPVESSDFLQASLLTMEIVTEQSRVDSIQLDISGTISFNVTICTSYIFLMCGLGQLDCWKLV